MKEVGGHYSKSILYAVKCLDDECVLLALTAFAVLVTMALARPNVARASDYGSQHVVIVYGQLDGENESECGE